MMAIFPRKYQHPRDRGMCGCGRPGFGGYLRRKMAIICPPLPCSCYGPAAGATLQGLCRKGYAVWGYAAGAMLHESWIMADDDDGW